MDADTRTLEWILGAVFIAFYAYKRYSTPETNRSSTTFSRFHSYYILYLLSLWAAYWIFGSIVETSPELLKRIAPLISPDNALELDKYQQMTGPVIAALILTTLLPNVPILASLDKRLLQTFWDLGRIPGNIIKQREWLRRAAFHIHPALHHEIIALAAGEGIDKQHLVFEQSDNLDYEWTRLASLLVRVSRWRECGEARYSRFMRNNRGEFESIRSEFITLSGRVASYFSKRSEIDLDKPDGRGELLQELCSQLELECDRLLKRICEFIARGVYFSELTEQGRRQTVSKLGFDEFSIVNENLSPGQLATLSFFIALTFLLMSIFQEYVNAREMAAMRMDKILFIAILMSVTYGLAAYAAIAPKSTWKWADYERLRARPWRAYLLSGIIAIIFGLFAMMSIRYTYNALSCDPSKLPIGVLCGTPYYFNKMMNDIAWSYPYLIQSFFIGYFTSWVTDNYQDVNSIDYPKTRYKDTIILALILAIGSIITFYALEIIKLEQFRGRSSWYIFALRGIIIGAIIGYLVPNWFRDNRAKTPSQRIERLLTRSTSDLEVEAGRLRVGELENALVYAAALVANADGQADQNECDYVRQFLYRLESYELGNFTADSAAKLFSQYSMALSRSNAKIREELLKPLLPHPNLSELAIQLSLAVAYADGVFEDAEEQAINQVLGILNLEAKRFMQPHNGPNTQRLAMARV